MTSSSGLVFACPRHRTALHRDAASLTCTEGHGFVASARGGFDFVGDSEPLTHLERHQRATYDDSHSRYAVQADSAAHDFMRRFAQTFARARLKGRAELLRQMTDACELKAAASVLEIGCNDGRYLNALAERYGVVGGGIDLSATAIERAHALRLHDSLEFHVAKADALPFVDNSFDAVVSFDVFEHLGHEALGRTMGEIARVLRPGGVLLCYVISQRDRFTFHETLRRITHQRFGVDDGEGHAFENFVDPALFRGLSDDVGLRVDAVRAYHGFWTLFADEHLHSALPRAAYKMLEWLDRPLTDLEYGNGFFGLSRKTEA